MPTVIFSHGKESGPYGKKIKRLIGIAEKHGHDTISIDYQGIDNPTKRVEVLENKLKTLGEKDVILVGSSMGGYVSTVAATRRPVLGLFLLCPALFMEGYEVQDYPIQTQKLMLIHGWNDDVIPYEHSIKFGQQHQGIVYLTNDNHRLSNTRDELAQQFTYFLESFE